MPTLMRWKGYRFHFWSGDRAVPPHVHVKKGKAEAKVWLQPVELAKSIDFAEHELAELVRKIRENELQFLRAWHDHFRH